MRSSGLLVLLLSVLGFAYGLWRLFDLRFSAGDIYPPYSSLRADPQGCRALYESLTAMPGFSVERNYRPLERFAAAANETIFYLGISPQVFEASSEDGLKELEHISNGGARLVIGFRPAIPGNEKKGGIPAVEKIWGVKFTYVQSATAPDRKSTALLLTAVDPRWTGEAILERHFGAGSIVLLPLAYPLSNEALHRGRDVNLLLSLIGGNTHVVFEESHLGVMQSESVAGLARKYRLQGVALALLLLAALLIWKNSTSLLPPRDIPSLDASVTSKYDSVSGLANLLRRNISPARLPQVCLEEWDRAQQRGQNRASHADSKMEQARLLAGRGGDPVAIYRDIVALLVETRT